MNLHLRCAQCKESALETQLQSNYLRVMFVIETCTHTIRQLYILAVLSYNLTKIRTFLVRKQQQQCELKWPIDMHNSSIRLSMHVSLTFVFGKCRKYSVHVHHHICTFRMWYPNLDENVHNSTRIALRTLNAHTPTDG